MWTSIYFVILMKTERVGMGKAKRAGRLQRGQEGQRGHRGYRVGKRLRGKTEMGETPLEAN